MAIQGPPTMPIFTSDSGATMKDGTVYSSINLWFANSKERDSFREWMRQHVGIGYTRMVEINNVR